MTSWEIHDGVYVVMFPGDRIFDLGVREVERGWGGREARREIEGGSMFFQI